MAIYVEVTISHPVSGVAQEAGRLRVSERSMHTWLPRTIVDAVGIPDEGRVEFQRNDCSVFARDERFALLHVEGRTTIDGVIVCEPGDEPVLGWRALSGLNLRIDERTSRLVDGGPIPAAATG